MDGIINIYKERGYTSFDVIAILRKKLGIKKIGHTGTLDPEAEGVLPVCVGKATKLADTIADKTKVYYAKMQLGIVTDTQDHTGRVLSTDEVECSEDEIITVIKSFVGEIQQVPPMYSAIKVNGKKLYELARAGKTIERQPRKITIYDITDIEMTGESVTFRVTCSKGTYIRTLCHDIGIKLGCGAHMAGLLRERSGIFTLDTAVKLTEIDQLLQTNSLQLIPIEQMFINYEAVRVDSTYNKYLYNGNKLLESYLVQTDTIKENDKYRVYDEIDEFIGLYVCLQDQNELLLKPLTLFI